MNVLIVEDHEATSENLARICRDEFGCTVSQALDLFTAKQEVSNGDFQLIVWDYNLPDGTTVQLIKTAHAKFPKAVMIASSSDMSRRQEQRAAGCTDDAGPFGISDLVREKLRSMV